MAQVTEHVLSQRTAVAPGGDVVPAAQQRAKAARNLLRTLIFYDQFQCPVRLGELPQRTINGLPDEWCADPQAMIETDPLLAVHVRVARGYVFLRSTAPQFEKWEAAERARRQRAQRYEKWVRLLCRFPFVRLIAVTGSLAFPMPTGEPDCDLFVVAARKRLWIVVALTRLVFFRILPKLRLVKYGEICPNYMIDEEAVLETAAARIPSHPDLAGDLFDSMQMAAMNLVVGRDIYEVLVATGSGLERFFPHWQPPAPLFESTVRSPPRRLARLMELALLLLPLDAINRWLHGCLSRRFAATSGRAESAQVATRSAAGLSAGWIRQAFNLTADLSQFTLHSFKAHGGRRLELLVRYEEALRNHPASVSIDLPGDRADTSKSA